MKTVLKFTAGTLMLLIFAIPVKALSPAGHPNGKSPLKIACSSDLLGLTDQWVAAYGILNPQSELELLDLVDVMELQGSGSLLQVGFRSDITKNYFKDDKYRMIAVGREVIVPIVSADNPFMNEISNHGVSIDALAGMLLGDGEGWDHFIGGAGHGMIVYYTSGDQALDEAVAAFLGVETSAIRGVKMTGPDEMISAVRQNKMAIGFCRLKDIISATEDEFVGGISLVPIDRNGNGKIDAIEDIYSSPSALNRGVWIGKYPKALVKDIYCIFDYANADAQEIAFMKWIINDGQSYLHSYGFTDLTIGEKHSAIAKLPTEKILPPVAPVRFPYLKFVLMLMVSAIILAFVIDYMMNYIRGVRKERAERLAAKPVLFDESSMNIPAGVFFDKSHTWAFMEKNGQVRVGLDDFLPHVTGRISAVKMKKPGENIIKGEVILTLVQKGKKLNIKSPVSGIIRQYNAGLEEVPSLINMSPYQDGWVYLIEPSNWLREIQFMFMADKFRIWMTSEFGRLKDFLAIMTNFGSRKLSTIVLQDGGRVKEGALEGLGPEAWEDFQTYFIEASA